MPLLSSKVLTLWGSSLLLCLVFGWFIWEGLII